MNLMKGLAAAVAALLLLTVAARPARKTMKPLSLHLRNPRYFIFRGKPTILLTSGEHYGALLNQDFDYLPYLDELQRRGFNLTRTFLGPYFEPAGAFNIRDNTLAPAQGRYLGPWARSDAPGFAGGGRKFDLRRWNPAYFERLRDFVAQAGKRGIVVEAVLFCPYYGEPQWRLSPLKASNNVNGIGGVPRTEVLTLKHADLWAVQEAYIRRLVSELRDRDSLYYEICNEPYFGGVTLAWQRRVAATIAAAEADLPAQRRHLIAQNIANGKAKVSDPDSRVSIFNFHYAAPPDAVAMNAGLERPIGFDESGFRGNADRPYRTEAWDFLLAGGAVYDGLDYSFTVGHPDGTAPVQAPTPGGGGPALRAQLATLKTFMESLDFIRMAPAPDLLTGRLPDGVTARALAEPGKQYAVYLQGEGAESLSLTAPAGRYRVEWLHPRTGEWPPPERVTHAGGRLDLRCPEYREDLALRLRRAR